MLDVKATAERVTRVLRLSERPVGDGEPIAPHSGYFATYGDLRAAAEQVRATFAAKLPELQALTKKIGEEVLLRAIIAKNIQVGGYPDTMGIARDAYALGVQHGEATSDPWVDTRMLRFDDTILFGHGGFDFDAWENFRSEMHTPHGSWAVWSCRNSRGKKVWSMYGGPMGHLALEAYSSEQHAKDDAEQIALSISAFARKATQ